MTRSMKQPQESPHVPYIQKPKRTLALDGFSFLRKLNRRTESTERVPKEDIPPELMTQGSQHHVPLMRISSPFTDATIQADFLDLFESISNHIRRHYTDEYCRQENLRAAITSFSTGLPLTVLDLTRLLRNGNTRLGALFLCVSWTILSRCLLLRSGISNSPSSTFLPPEIVQSFQNFTFGRIVTESGIDEHSETDWKLLIQWKQTLAVLMHSAYVSNGFSHLDSRLPNMERALQDLDPLLRIYALTGSTERIADLRIVLQKGAKFAFTLFAEPYVWQFEWEEDNLSIPDDSSHSGDLKSTKTIKRDFKVRRESQLSSFTSPQPDLSSVVIWPALLRVVGSDGKQIEGMHKMLTKKKLLRSFTAPDA